MKLIPVVDLLGGRVVHARRGDRAAYRPLRSPLCASDDPLAVVDALLALHRFSTIYLADLAAILGGAAQTATWARLRDRCPDVEIWIDAGFRSADAVSPWLDLAGIRPVIGSETWQATTELDRLASAGMLDRAVLSLDFRGQHLLAPPGLLEPGTAWPPDVIAMTLDRVGSDAGPDLDRLAALQSGRAAHWYAAGGVRNPEDLAELEARGLAGVLVATALHESRLPPSILAHYQ